MIEITRFGGVHVVKHGKILAGLLHMSLSLLARRLRHAPGFERMDPLWNAVRRPYLAIARHFGGVTLKLGGCAVRVPVEFSNQGWEWYECEAMGRFVGWVQNHTDGMVLDVGSSVGLYTHVALSISPSVSAIAIDSDIASVAALVRLTAAVAENRLTTLCCLIGDVPSIETDLTTCGDATRARVHSHGASLAAIKYVCLGATDLPVCTLDQLVSVEELRPLLLKIDVEGGELHVLRGAQRLLRRPRVTVLLSVHPEHLQRDFNTSAAEVRAFLESSGYQIEIVATDHEEHWWCVGSRCGQ